MIEKWKNNISFGKVGMESIQRQTEICSGP
jgi:hypothetical protein